MSEGLGQEAVAKGLTRGSWSGGESPAAPGCALLGGLPARGLRLLDAAAAQARSPTSTASSRVPTFARR